MNKLSHNNNKMLLLLFLLLLLQLFIVSIISEIEHTCLQNCVQISSAVCEKLLHKHCIRTTGNPLNRILQHTCHGFVCCFMHDPCSTYHSFHFNYMINFLALNEIIEHSCKQANESTSKRTH